ncbi:MAG: hypothetical protein PHN33_00805 [Candidatus Peribacteraceae bacterium]|jgi:hypothetical protein|nr:hypothetical protein [Candidatus Peribacteraceae bacterium]
MEEWRRLSEREQEAAIEEAAQWARENGRDDSSIRSAARQFCGDDSAKIVEAIRTKIRDLLS